MTEVKQALDGERAELAAQSYQAGYAAAFNQSAFGMVKTDLDGRLLLVNDRFCDITGYRRDALLGKSFFDITHPDDLAANRALFQELRAGAIPSYQIEKRYLRQDGSVRWGQVSASVDFDSHGQPQGLIAGVQDISEAKRKQQTLRFLVELNAATQQLSDPEQIMAVVARMLGEYLEVNRCVYLELHPGQDYCTVTGDYAVDVPSIVGQLRLADFGEEVLQLLQADKPLVINDIATDARTCARAEAFRRIQIQAQIAVPLFKDGSWVAAMAVHQNAPRDWARGEIELVQMVVSRCWESIERAQSLRSLRQNERQLRFVMDTVPQKIFTCQANGESLYYNLPWTDYTGLSNEALLGWGWLDIIHPDDLDQNLRIWRESLASGQPFSFQHRFRTRQGDYRWHLSRAEPLRDDAGGAMMWVGSCIDIHDARSKELSLTQTLASERQQAALLARLAGASRTIHAVLSADSIANMLAEEARALIGVHQAVVSLTNNSNWAQAITAVSLSDKYARYRSYSEPTDGSGISTEICRTNRAMRLTQAELERHPAWKGFGKERHRHPPMNGWLAVPLVGLGGKNLGLIQASDKYEGEFTEDDESVLTQLAMIASVGIENALLYDSLREQDRRKDEFLATLAHELRNPLAPIRTGLELLNRVTDHDPEQTRRIRRIMNTQLAHLVRLVDDLMDISRVSRGKVELKREPIALQSVLDSAIEASRPLIDVAKHQLLVEYPDTPLQIFGDPTRLSQVLSNLLNNAAKYTVAGGTIILSAGLEDQQAVIRVKDTGIGISADMLPKIFDLFTQVDPGIDRAQGGLGIGLSLVQKLVDMHGGKIIAESPGLGHGSTFSVWLPVLATAAAQAELPAPVVSPIRAPIGGKRLLVVDDNTDAAATLSMLLEVLGHQVNVAHSGPTALEQAQRSVPELVFLDIGLPGMNGYDVATRLRADPQFSRTVLVALTGWGSEEDRKRSRAAGFHFHLTKPIDIQDLTGVFEKFFPPEGV